jgi:hypothetical protein
MNKYNSKLTKVDGIEFHSAKEAAHYGKLLAALFNGDIHDLKLQPKFELIPKGDGIARPTHYVADFSYIKDAKLVVEDIKGFKGGQAYALYKLKCKLMQHVHGIKVTEI